MPSPFPGMDPYLEYPAFWSSFHTRMMVAIAESIEPQLSLQYYVEVESRTYRSDESEESQEVLIGIPDAVVLSQQSELQSESPNIDLDREETAIATQIRPDKVTLPMPIEVKERYLEIREMTTDQVITVIELLSPKNKRSGTGRTAYEKKRRSILGSQTHLVELDLLRAAKPMTVLGARSTSTYRILVSRSHQRPTADLYSVDLRQPLPSFPVPLKLGETEPIVPLQEILGQVYERARYAARIDYQQSVPAPALSEADQDWVDRVLTAQPG